MLLGERQSPAILTTGNLLVLRFEELLVVFVLIRIVGGLVIMPFLFPPVVDLIWNVIVIVIVVVYNVYDDDDDHDV